MIDFCLPQNELMSKAEENRHVSLCLEDAMKETNELKSQVGKVDRSCLIIKYTLQVVQKLDFMLTVNVTDVVKPRVQSLTQVTTHALALCSNSLN